MTRHSELQSRRQNRVEGHRLEDMLLLQLAHEIPDRLLGFANYLRAHARVERAIWLVFASVIAGWLLYGFRNGLFQSLRSTTRRASSSSDSSSPGWSSDGGWSFKPKKI